MLQPLQNNALISVKFSANNEATFGTYRVHEVIEYLNRSFIWAEHFVEACTEQGWPIMPINDHLGTVVSLEVDIPFLTVTDIINKFCPPTELQVIDGELYDMSDGIPWRV